MDHSDCPILSIDLHLFPLPLYPPVGVLYDFDALPNTQGEISTGET